MKFLRPKEVRRSFARGSAITQYRVPFSATASPKSRHRRQHVSHWPGTRLNYGFLDRCKTLICRIPHPNQYMQHLTREYRLSVLPWSRGAYVDVRQYTMRGGSPVGILLHLDVISALLPELIRVVRRLEQEDTRTPEEKQPVHVILVDVAPRPFGSEHNGD